MLIGERVLLRALKITDVVLLNKWRNNLELIKLTQGVRFPKTLEMDEGWFISQSNDKSNKNVIFGIEEISSNSFIGLIQITNIDWISRIGEFGVSIGENNKAGLGYGTEAMELFFSYIFQELNLRKISLRVASFNENAIKSYRKLGFVEEGTLKEHSFFGDKYNDIILMALFKDSKSNV